MDLRARLSAVNITPTATGRLGSAAGSRIDSSTPKPAVDRGGLTAVVSGSAPRAPGDRFDLPLDLVAGLELVRAVGGGVAQVGGILRRLRDLAEQCCDSTLADEVRAALAQQYEDGLGELDQVAGAAEHAGIRLLDGTGGVVPIRVDSVTGGLGTLNAELWSSYDTAGLSLVCGLRDADEARAARGEIDAALALADAAATVWRDAEAQLVQALGEHGRTPRGSYFSGRA
jgi:hypothetical protein